MNIEKTLNVTKEKIEKRINLYNSKYKGNYDLEENMFETFKRYEFFYLEEEFEKRDNIYLWNNGHIHISTDIKKFFNFLKENYSFQRIEKSSWTLNLKEDDDFYLHFLEKKYFNSPHRLFLKHFFNLKSVFNCSFTPPGGQVEIGKNSELGPVINYLIENKIPSFFERVNFESYSCFTYNASLTEDGFEKSFFLINSIDI